MAKKPSGRKTQANTSETKSAQYGEQTVTVGAGGETHQIADDGAPVLPPNRALQYPMIKIH